MTPRELEEYKALRATIRERGTARIWVFVTGLAAWAALTLATASLFSLPVATLVPLLVLAGLFEAVLALHTGVERIGRYIQVFYESDETDPASTGRWEHTAMAFGGVASGVRLDPLFSVVFWAATLLNLMPAILAGAVPVEWAAIGPAHVLFAVRVAVAGRSAARQRVVDLERFQALKKG